MGDDIMTVEYLRAKLVELDNGKLYRGSHAASSRQFCVLEFDAKLRGRAHNDWPITLPDLRNLNDAQWSSDEMRTEHMLPVMVAYWDWSTWTLERKCEVIGRLAIRIVQEIVSALPGLPDDARVACRKATTLGEAETAANAAAAACVYTNEAVVANSAAAACVAAFVYDSGAPSAVYTYAGGAANAAETYAAGTAAYAAVVADEAVLITACRLWIEAATS